VYFNWICPKCKHENENTVEDAMENNTVCQNCYEDYDIKVYVEVVVQDIKSKGNMKDKRY
jgi:uncharacterized protein YbaR (Trm112 family)